VKVDLIVPIHNRLEFTKATLKALVANTSWEKVRNFFIYEDASEDGTLEWLDRECPIPALMSPVILRGRYGSPVAVMMDALDRIGTDAIMAKVDNDTVVPPGWLDDCLAVMEKYPELDLLGIEAFHPSAPCPAERTYEPARFIGGIGLFRTRVFRQDRPVPNGRFGFTEWQERREDIIKGWLNPALPVFLLDHLPMEPWTSLTEEYIAKGWSRRWSKYDPAQHGKLWEWWTP
jgi:GT2 family glycosyltransferase